MNNNVNLEIESLLPWQILIVEEAVNIAVSEPDTITPYFNWNTNPKVISFFFQESCRRYSAWRDPDETIRYYREAGQFINPLSRDEFLKGIASGFGEYYDGHTSLHWPKTTLENLVVALKKKWIGVAITE